MMAITTAPMQEMKDARQFSAPQLKKTVPAQKPALKQTKKSSGGGKLTFEITIDFVVGPVAETPSLSTSFEHLESAETSNREAVVEHDEDSSGSRSDEASTETEEETESDEEGLDTGETEDTGATEEEREMTEKLADNAILGEAIDAMIETEHDLENLDVDYWSDDGGGDEVYMKVAANAYAKSCVTSSKISTRW